MTITEIIEKSVTEAVKELYGQEILPEQITMNTTRKEFEGDYTVVVFPFTRIAGKKPEQIGKDLGDFLVDRVEQIVGYNVIKGFLNLVISDQYWQEFLRLIYDQEDYGLQPSNGKKVMVEFSSPNTNKPLHLGHIRNILLGWSSSRILEAAGYEVVKVQIVNDRGIAICKSMLAWEKFGEGATPASTGIKSDHFVGQFYVLFEKKIREEYSSWQQSKEAQTIYRQQKADKQSELAFFKAFRNTYFNAYSPLGREAKEMLLKWESGDEKTIALWKKMNQWVYEGFEATYKNLGVSFDKLYFESDTYVLGKDIIERGLAEGVFYKKEDDSVWIDLENAGLDHKLVLRSDGTSVYMTQDLGTARLRYEDFGVDKMVYVVADEQNYHFQALFEILKRLNEPYAAGLYHLSYGMVDLPGGKMKSREGTIVDADDLIEEVLQEARIVAEDSAPIQEMDAESREETIRKIALAALKFFIIKVHPKKRMIFDPKESVDLKGQTGPYIQNAYVRIKSVLRKAEGLSAKNAGAYPDINTMEKDLIAEIYHFPEIIAVAAEEYDPSAIANYCYNLARSFHRFYHDYSILKAESEQAAAFRLALSQAVSIVLKRGMDLLGIEMPERM